MRGKAACERAFGALRSLLFEHLPGYTGIDVADRGADPEADATLTMEQMERLISQWVIQVWQCRALGEHAPAWGPGGEHSPNSLFAAAMNQGGVALQVPRPELYYELLPVHQVKIHADRGVKIGGPWYGPARPRVQAAPGKTTAQGRGPARPPRATGRPGTAPAGGPPAAAGGGRWFRPAGRSRRPGPATGSTPSAGAVASRPSRSGPPRPGRSATSCAPPACWRFPGTTGNERAQPGTGTAPSRVVPARAGAGPCQVGGLDPAASHPPGLRPGPGDHRRRASCADAAAAAPAHPPPG